MDLGTIGGEGLGPYGKNTGSGNGLTQVISAVSSIIGFLTIAAIIWFMFQILLAGISWISAGGDKHKLTESRDRLTNALIGIVIVIAGWAILSLAGQFFGVDFTLSSPDTILNLIQFK